MRRALAALCLLPFAQAQTVDLSSIRRATFVSLEKRFDKRLMSTPPDDPFDLLGTTRGLYLEGYGAVFTAELSLVVTPALTPFRRTMSAEDAHRIWVRKTKALGVLRQAMREMLVDSADALAMIPAKEQVVFAVRLLYLSWEKTDTLPAHIVVRGERAALMKHGPSLSVVRVEEF